MFTTTWMILGDDTRWWEMWVRRDVWGLDKENNQSICWLLQPDILSAAKRPLTVLSTSTGSHWFPPAYVHLQVFLILQGISLSGTCAKRPTDRLQLSKPLVHSGLSDPEPACFSDPNRNLTGRLTGWISSRILPLVIGSPGRSSPLVMWHNVTLMWLMWRIHLRGLSVIVTWISSLVCIVKLPLNFEKIKLAWVGCKLKKKTSKQINA